MIFRGDDADPRQEEFAFEERVAQAPLQPGGIFSRESKDSGSRTEERNSGVGSSVLLSEHTFINENERQINSVDEVKNQLSMFSEQSLPINAQESEEGFFDPLIRSMFDNTYKVDVSNLKEGIINPLTNTFGEWHRQSIDVTRRNHKMNILYLAAIRDSNRNSSKRINTGIENSIREGYFSFTKSAFSMLGSLISPIFKGVSTVLFGFRKKEKTMVQAIEEQTQFLRTGKIVDISSPLERFLRRGVVGGAIAGGAEMAGLGRSAAQSAEDKVSRGEELTRRESLTREMMFRMDWFKDIDRKDLTGQPRQREAQMGVMETVNETISNFFESFKDRSKMSYDLLADFKNENAAKLEGIIGSFGTLVSAFQGGSSGDDNVIPMGSDPSSRVSRDSNDERSTESVITKLPADIGREVSERSEKDSVRLVETMYTLSRRETRETSQDAFTNYMVLKNINEELMKMNRPVLSAYENRMVDLNKQQYNELVKQRELDEQRRFEEETNKKDSGGGLLAALGTAMKPIGKLAKRFIYLPVLAAFKSTGGWIAKTSMRFIVTPLIGAVKAGGAWLARNGFKTLLRAPFAKIFAVGLIGKLFYDHLLRPMVGWFDDTFGTQIGATLDKFTGFFSDKFVGMVDWIKDHLASIPVIGKLFKEERSKEDKERIANTNIMDPAEMIRLRQEGVDVGMDDVINRGTEERGEKLGGLGILNNIGKSFWDFQKASGKKIWDASMWVGNKTFDYTKATTGMATNLITGGGDSSQQREAPVTTADRSRAMSSSIGSGVSDAGGATAAIARETGGFIFDSTKSISSKVVDAWSNIFNNDTTSKELTDKIVDKEKTKSSILDTYKSFWGSVTNAFSSKEAEEKILSNEKVKESKDSMFKSLVRNTAEIYSSVWSGFAEGASETNQPRPPRSPVENVRQPEQEESSVDAVRESMNRVSRDIKESNEQATRTNRELLEAQMTQTSQMIELLANVSNNTGAGVRAQIEAVSAQMSEARKNRALNTSDGDL